MDQWEPTAEQMALLRQALCVPPGDPDPSQADLAAVLEAETVVLDEARRLGQAPP
jgi:hypothetical protein